MTAPRRPILAISLAWAAALAVVALTTANCSVDHPSDGFACTTSADCSGGRTCVESFCVTSGSGVTKLDGGTPIDARVPIDGGAPHPDASACPAICTSCDAAAKRCEIDCSQTDACVNNGPVTCPTGFTCTIECSVNGSCRNVVCTNAASCTVTCSGPDSCRAVSCGQGACDVTCNGPGTCRDVTCGASCACDVSCTGPQSCQAVTCTLPFCSDGDGGCDSTASAQCDTCP